MANQTKLIYQIEFFSDWHLSSGLSVAGDIDAAVLKDEDTGLPYIPGKTLKGMLRHAAYTIRAFQPSHPLITENFVRNVFGCEDPLNYDEVTSVEGKEVQSECFFSNAYLSPDLQKEIEGNAYNDFIYRKIASTAIEENGIAKKHSLRKMEVAIPLVLFAYIDHVEDEWKNKFEILFKMVKRMGLSRHRGFGRCEFSILK